MEKLDIELDIIKCKIHEEDLQEHFKEKLEERINNAYESKTYTTIPNNKNSISIPFGFHKAVAALFICVFMFSTCAFAGGVGDWLKDMFSNINKEMEIAYENGEIKEVNTEYQTFDDISVKIDYIALRDNELYVVFNAKSEEKYKNIDIDRIKILDKDDNVIFNNSNSFLNDYEYDSMKKSIDSTEKEIFLTIFQKEKIFQKYDILKINIENIITEDDDSARQHSGDWSFEINLNR